MQYPLTHDHRQLFQMALREDMPYGDITSENLDITHADGIGVVIAKQNLIIAGIPVAFEIFNLVDETLRIITTKHDGQMLEKGEKILEVYGKYVSILKAERTMLNFLQRLTGIATLTDQVVKQLADSKVRVTDTRKTTPLWRSLEKYAVRMGNGHNHRFCLSDAVMIKDNHIAAVGSITEAVARVRCNIPHTATVEVEVSTLEQVDEALKADVDIIMLDNMDEGTIVQAVNRIKGKALIEASGGITLKSIKNIARTGVDIISLGALTHSAPAADISLDLQPYRQ